MKMPIELYMGRDPLWWNNVYFEARWDKLPNESLCFGGCYSVLRDVAKRVYDNGTVEIVAREEIYPQITHIRHCEFYP